MRAARAAVGLPVLRKDFTVDPLQLYEARAAGADAALVIVPALEPRALEALVAESADAGLGMLVEIHDREEARPALAAGASVIGVNARDLSSLAVDVDAALATVEWLRGEAPDAVIVAESGIASAKRP